MLGRAQSARVQPDIDIIMIAVVAVEIYPLVIGDIEVGWPLTRSGHLPVDHVRAGVIFRGSQKLLRPCSDR